MIIPDSITPYIGIKCLEIRGDTLHSPQQGTAWPKRRRLEATCKYRAIEWELRDAPEGWEENFWVPSSLLTEGGTTQVGWPPDPAPEGKTWVPRPAEHEIAKCKGPCGIYVVDTPQQCEPYLRGSWHGHRVLVSISLWGQVVVGEKGARGQYAYPVRVVGPWQWESELQAVAKEYGIKYTPVVVEEATDDDFHRVLRISA